MKKYLIPFLTVVGALAMPLLSHAAVIVNTTADAGSGNVYRAPSGSSNQDMISYIATLGFSVSTSDIWTYTQPAAPSQTSCFVAGCYMFLTDSSGNWKATLFGPTDGDMQAGFTATTTGISANVGDILYFYLRGHGTSNPTNLPALNFDLGTSISSGACYNALNYFVTNELGNSLVNPRDWGSCSYPFALEVDAGPSTPPAPSASFLWPTEGTTTPLFDNFVIKGANLTSTDEYTVIGNWYLSLTRQTTQWDQVQVSGSDLMNGINIPLVGFPQVPNSDIENLPANASFQLVDDTAVQFVTSSTVAFNIASQNNTTTPIFYLVDASSTTGGGFTITTSSQSVNPFFSTGGVVCPAPTGTIFGGDLGPTISYAFCQLGNLFIYPHTYTQNLVQQSFNAVQKDVPFAYVFAAFTGISSSSQSVATTSALDFSFALNHGNTGVMHIVPTSSIKLIDNTAYADLTGDPSFDASTHSAIFAAEDYVMYALLIAFIVLIVVKKRDQFH